MHYLKLVKEGTIEDFIQSDDAKFPCVCCYSESHPNYSTQQDAIITKSKPSNKPILSFTIEATEPAPPGYIIGETCTLQFEEGMSWGEWCNSKYNTLGWYILYGDYLDFVVHNFGDYVVYRDSSVRPTEIILNDTYNYYA